MTSPDRRTVPTDDLPAITGSFALALGPLARALHEYARVTGSRGISSLAFTACNAEQAQIVEWILAHLVEIPQLRDLESLASPDWMVLNQFLEARGFDPLFTPFPDSDLGITSVIDATMLWEEAGTATTIERQGVMYPAFKLTDQTPCLYRLNNAGPFGDCIVIRTQSDHRLFLAMLPEDHPAPPNGAELLRLAGQMLGADASLLDDSGGIVVPKINLDVVNDLPWLNGLRVATPDGANYPLAQCRQHVKLYMDQRGAHLAAAFAGVVIRDRAPRPYVINRHFVLAVMDGTTPTAVFYLNPDDSWSEPPAGAIAAE